MVLGLKVPFREIGIAALGRLGVKLPDFKMFGVNNIDVVILEVWGSENCNIT